VEEGVSSIIVNRPAVIVVTHVVPFPATAGNEIRILKLLQWLKERGCKTILLLNQPGITGEIRRRLEKIVDAVHITDISDSQVDQSIVVQPIVKTLQHLNQVKRNLCPPKLIYMTHALCKKYRPISVIAEYVFTAPCLTAVPSGIMKMIDTHDMFSRRDPKEDLHCNPDEERAYLLNGDIIIAIQQEEARMLGSLVPERQVITVGIDFKVVEHTDNNKALPGTVLVVGSDNTPNIEGLKSFYACAWPLIKQSLPFAKLRIVGKLGRAFENLQDVERVGWVEQISTEYERAAVVINPTSVGTGLKIKTVEALCNGKAFVGTPNSIEGLPIASRHPYKVAGDWPTFAKAIFSLLTSEEERSALQKEAIAYARQNFNKETIYAPLQALIEQHLGTTSHGKGLCPVCRLGNVKAFGEMQWTMDGADYCLVQCSKCESVHTFPLPDDATLRRFYESVFDYGWYQDHYGAKLLDSQQRIEEYRQIMGKRVLDFGGGLGYFSQVARKEGFDCTNFDPYTTGGEIPVNDLDTVISLHALEHSNDLDRTIDLIKKNLLPGGNLILAVPNFECEGYSRLGMDWVWAQPPFLHLFHFTAVGLSHLLGRHGFANLRISYRERWDANLHTDLQEVTKFRGLDAEWRSRDVNPSPVKRAMVAWKNSILRFEGLQKALEGFDPSNSKYAELEVVATYGSTSTVRAGAIIKGGHKGFHQNVMNFEISKNEVSFDKLFYSAFATPGRYVMELFTRLSSIRGHEDILVFNPFFNMPHALTEHVFEELNKTFQCKDLTVFADRNEVPLAYFFPRNIPINDARFLTLVSAMHAEVDTAYLRNALLVPARCAYLRNVSLNKAVENNDFNYNLTYDNLYTWVTDSALIALTSQYGRALSNDALQHINAEEIKQLRHQRNSIPFVAIMPHHAGDMLFLSIALKNNTSHITRVILSERYSDILQDCAPMVRPISFPFTPMLHDGITRPDEEYFFDVVSYLKTEDIQNSLYYYCRPSREYRVSDFHLIDHYCFALGSGLQSKEDFLSSRPLPQHYLPEKKNRPFKILLHTEGGWPLKTYPENNFQMLIDRFHREGYEITLLGSRSINSNRIKTVKYSNLKNFKDLLAAHHLLIGMDSFPVHYAAHIIGSPTICLFGNTKPVNSDAPLSNYYQYLTNDLDCAGCFGFDKCPRNGRQFCNNFPEPEKILLATVAILKRLYGHPACENIEIQKERGEQPS
jgi:glycosyltransferase involved in cell wall biosynthesis